MSKPGEVWLAEVGDHGWSQICKDFKEAAEVVQERRSALEIYGQTSRELYDCWAIWCNGEFVVGHWPLKR